MLYTFFVCARKKCFGQFSCSFGLSIMCVSDFYLFCAHFCQLLCSFVLEKCKIARNAFQCHPKSSRKSSKCAKLWISCDPHTQLCVSSPFKKGSKKIFLIKNTHATHEREEERRWPPNNFFSKEIFSFELLFAPLMWVGDIWWDLFQSRADQICHAWELYLKWLMKIRDVLKVCAYVHAVSLWLFLMSFHHVNSLE